MNSNKEYSVLQPKYYREFQCDPTRCLETCCERWKITIDKSTYQKYIKSDNAIIKDIVASGLSKNQDSKSDDDFGIINLDKDMECPFLNKDGFCEVIINMGESCLSKTCKNYPRATFMINDVIERGLQMSCSIAAELALLNENGMEFERTKATINPNDIFINSMNIDESDCIKIYIEIRALIIEILQNRKIGLNERIVTVGNFLNQIVVHKKFPDFNYEEILSLVDETRKSLSDNNFISRLKSDPIQYKDQFNILNSILAMKFSEGNGIATASKRYIECLWPVLDAFDNIKDSTIATFYKGNFEKYLKPYLNEKEFILENFLVNYVFIYRDELFQIDKLWHFYIKLCVVYGLIKFNLIGLATYYKGMDDELVLKLIQSLTKTIIPDDNYLNSVVNYLEEIKVTELSKLHTLIMS
ncbi:flagellin lysine-N-methylase [Vallitalea okinawensis]|uniref:flagellin lysine-N-methylase n=1 Tax=Vallitalea okinawensis TaxID=2078660 RepID=UPI000CFAB857|nr:flagellin lysine-N-methylase [Vallitalea okinawensis]